MFKFSSSLWVVPAGMSLLYLAAPAAIGAVGNDEPQVAAVTLPAVRSLENTADVQLRFLQEDGPDSGHVRIELTPDNRALTIFEARSAAQQAFLEALTEPGLGDNLKQITVVVRLLPGADVSQPGSEQTFLFLHKGGRDWGIFAGD